MGSGYGCYDSRAVVGVRACEPVDDCIHSVMLCDYCGVTLVRPGVVVESSGLHRLSRGFSRLVALSSTVFPGPLSSGLPPGRSTASPTAESSTTVHQVHRGGSNPLSSL